MKHKLYALFLSLCLVLSCGAAADFNTAAENTSGYIDNSSLTPVFVTDDKVTLTPINNGALMSPDWVNSLIIEEINVKNVSPNGRFSGMTYVLDHLQQMGVNGIWLTPIYGGLHYLNYGPETVDSYLTGTADYDEGWKVVADFVKQAHDRNIRIFLDIVTWGASPFAPIVTEHPDWFSGYNEKYKGQQYDWKNQELVNWFSDELIDIVNKTDIDGFRADCGIDYGCKPMYEKVRSTLYKNNNYIIIIGETVNEDTADIFDFDEHSVNYDIGTQGKNYIDGTLNMVSAVKTGYGLDTIKRQRAGTAGLNTYYTSIVTCHDTKGYLGNGGYVPMAYASILSPFIPLWYCGEEWNNTYTSTGWLWDTGIFWGELETNRDYFENIKAYIRIRRLYPEIFNDFPTNHRDINICEVATDHTNAFAKAYARYGNGKGILVVPNQGEMSTRFDITIPYENMGLSTSGVYTVENLMTGKTVATGKADDLKGISATIVNKNVAVYLVRPAEANEDITVQRSADNATDSGKTPSSNKPQNTNTTTSSEKTDNNSSESNSSKNTDTESKNESEKKESTNSDDTFEIELWMIISGAVLLVLIIGGAIVLIVIRNKKKKLLP